MDKMAQFYNQTNLGKSINNDEIIGYVKSFKHVIL